MTTARGDHILRLVLSLLLSLGAAPVGAQAPEELYEPVLQHVQAEHAPRPLILYSTVLELECYRGGCDEPWAGTLPQAWMEEVRSRGIVAEFCAYDHGLCVRPDGSPVFSADGVYVMLSTGKDCGCGCAEVLATESLVSDGTSMRRHRLHRLVRRSGEWSVASVKDGGRAIIN